MFTPEERCTVRDLLLERAQNDEMIIAAALTGSCSHDAEDRWSDIDLYFGVANETTREDALGEWSSFLYRELGALHHFDLDAGYAIYRGFLLPGRLEVDIAFADADRFGPLGPLFRPVFGTVVEQPVAGEHGPQAEYWISAIRDHVLTLACLRLGLSTAYAKGADALPSEITAPLEKGLAASLEPQELSRALSATVTALLQEIDAADPDLSARLHPVLQPLASPET